MQTPFFMALWFYGFEKLEFIISSAALPVEAIENDVISKYRTSQ